MMRRGRGEEGDDERELNDGSGEGRREEGSWIEKGRNDIYRRRQSLVSVSSGCPEAHLSVFFVFFSLDTVLQLIVFRSPFATIIRSLSPSCRLGYSLPAGQEENAALSFPRLLADCVY